MIRSQQGIGLVEVIVSLLLLAVATLGFVAMQGGAMKLTSESEERTRSLAVMRDISEKIRVNPTAIDTYIEKINTPDTTEPSKDCGLYSVSSVPKGKDNDSVICTANELAIAHAFYINQKIEESDFEIKIEPCPNSKDNGKGSVMYSYCILSAWGDTIATISEDEENTNGKTNCLKDDGNYHPSATCMQIGLD